ncbi:MAG TPA: N-acetylneuraminate synthase family protein, partial [Candidatus Polarisedimenticolaceae bacterium]|nr:N-acetylneuraminate synthase family protein [Candidatus Polarisedimenticolaceae bacterium]
MAEIGINHNGSLDVARELVDAAARAGVEVVKHQSHVIADEMTAAARAVIPGNADRSIYEIMAQCALSPDDERELKRYVESRGMIFLSTPFSRAAADNLQRMRVEGYKIGSGECNNYPLIDHVARFGKPVILSTGMNSIESVGPAVEILRAHRVPFALLHCTNVYPTPARLVRLGAMAELKAAFPDAVVGLSDHTQGNYTCFAAVALGAAIVERHFTDRMDREGPDVVCSADERAMAELIEGSRQIFLARGGHKTPVEEERVTMEFAFATVVAIRPIARGETLSRENIWVKRPGTGEIGAMHFERLLGRTAARDVPCD